MVVVVIVLLFFVFKNKSTSARPTMTKKHFSSGIAEAFHKLYHYSLTLITIMSHLNGQNICYCWLLSRIQLLFSPSLLVLFCVVHFLGHFYSVCWYSNLVDETEKNLVLSRPTPSKCKIFLFFHHGKMHVIKQSTIMKKKVTFIHYNDYLWTVYWSLLILNNVL